MSFKIVGNKKEAVILSGERFDQIKKYIDDHYIQEEFEMSELQAPMPSYSQAAPMEKKKRKLEDLIAQVEETFSERLLGLIDEKVMTDVQAYKAANVDRRLFSKIRSDQDYNPSKTTAIAFAIALQLNLDEANDLLSRAGYALSPSSEFDLIIRFFIEEGTYDIYEINATLFKFNQKPLGA